MIEITCQIGIQLGSRLPFGHFSNCLVSRIFASTAVCLRAVLLSNGQSPCFAESPCAEVNACARSHVAPWHEEPPAHVGVLVGERDSGVVLSASCDACSEPPTLVVMLGLDPAQDQWVNGCSRSRNHFGLPKPHGKEAGLFY
jgi:hypothetical protein